MDADEAYGEKAREQLHKNASSCSEQILVAASHKTASVQPLITKTIQIRRTRYAGHSWRNKDELIFDVLLWTFSYERARVGRPARTYIQHFCTETGCILEDLPGAMDDRDEWRHDLMMIR